jgi:hypothetical protein
LADPTVSSPATVGVGAYVGIFNGALHTLWKANYFRAVVDGTTLGSGVPAGTTLDVTTRLPPVAYINNSNVVQLHLGAVDLIINHPQLPPDLSVRLGAEAHANVSLNGNDLVFGGIVVDQVHASTDAINLSTTEQQSLQTLLQALAQQLVNQSLNSALPAIPIPAFPLPQSLSQYGLPPGARLGVTSQGLQVAPQHFTLRGGFGIVP